MASSTAYQGALTRTDQDLMKSYGDQYNAAKAAGNRAGMNAAHQAAEKLRSSYGYTGGTTGANYNSTQEGSEVGYVDRITEAQRQANIAALKNTYNANMLSLDATEAKLPGTYNTARDKAYTQSEIGRQNWNEYAAGAGMNSGVGAQAQLARTNALQRDLTDINRAQAQAQSEIDLQRQQVELAYKNAVREAIANGELARANQLYELAKERTSTMATVGDFSGYRQLGYTQAQVDALKKAWDEQKALEEAQAYGYSSGGGGGGGGGRSYSSGGGGSSSGSSGYSAPVSARNPAEGRVVYVQGMGYVTGQELSDGIKSGQISAGSGGSYRIK